MRLAEIVEQLLESFDKLHDPLKIDQVHRLENGAFVRLRLDRRASWLHLVPLKQGSPAYIEPAMLPSAFIDRKHELEQGALGLQSKKHDLAFVVETMGASGAQLCKDKGYGYFDLHGRVFLHTPGVFIEKATKSAAVLGSSRKFPYSHISDWALRALVCNPANHWSVRGFASETGLSSASVTRVMGVLAAQGFVFAKLRSREGYRVNRRTPILDLWRDLYRPHIAFTLKYVLPSAVAVSRVEQQICSALHSAGVEYAVGGYGAAMHYGTTGNHNESLIYALGARDQLSELARSLKLSSGPAGQIALACPFDKRYFYQSTTTGKVRYVHIAQAYLDLRRAAGRGVDNARLFREAYIDLDGEGSQ